MTAIAPPGLRGNDAAGDIPLFFLNYFYTRRRASPVVACVLSHIQTTERYVGLRQNLHDAPCDRLWLVGLVG